MKLEIISPTGKLYEGSVTSVSVPGAYSAFTILNNHAPIISSLSKGRVEYVEEVSGEAHTMVIDGGFVEVEKNVVTICIENVVG